MEIKVGDKIKVSIEDYTQKRWSKFWHGSRMVVKEAEVKEIKDYNSGFSPLIMVEIDGFMPKCFTLWDLRHAMTRVDPEIFATKQDKIVISPL